MEKIDPLIEGKILTRLKAFMQLKKIVWQRSIMSKSLLDARSISRLNHILPKWIIWRKLQSHALMARMLYLNPQLEQARLYPYSVHLQPGLNLKDRNCSIWQKAVKCKIQICHKSSTPVELILSFPKYKMSLKTQ